MSNIDGVPTRVAGPPSSSGNHNDITVDVDHIVRDYFTTVNAKDDDIFQLYADNERLRDLAETSLKRRQDLETQLASQNLLLEALRTEIHEHKHLLAAQEQEGHMLRDGAATLRAVLGQPSAQLSVTLDDVVQEVRHLVNDRLELEEALAALDSRAQRMSHSYARLLLDEERRERRRLEDAALLPFSSPLFTESFKDLEIFARHVEAALHHTRVADAQAATEAEERYQMEVQQATLRATTAIRALKQEKQWALENRNANAWRELFDGERLVRYANTMETYYSPLIDMLMTRCATSETQWHVLQSQLTDLMPRYNDSERLRRQFEEEVARLTATLAQERETCGKLRRQHAKDDALRKELETCQDRLLFRGRELDEIKDKSVALCQKLVAQRQQYTGTVKELRGTVEELQSRVQELQRRNVHLEDRTTTLQDEVKGKTKRAAVLERKLEDAAESVKAAEASWAKEKQSLAVQHAEEQAATVALAEQKCLALFDEERQNMQTQFTCQMEALTAQHKEEVAAQAAAHAAGMEQQTQGFHLEKSSLTHEIQEWVSLVDKLRDELRHAQSQLAAEQSARSVLEDQQRSEAAMLLRITGQQKDAPPARSDKPAFAKEATGRPDGVPANAEDPAATATAQELLAFLEQQTITTPAQQTGPHEHESTTAVLAERDALKRQVHVLEQACRRSATVITELREAQHALQQQQQRQRQELQRSRSSFLAASPPHGLYHQQQQGSKQPQQRADARSPWVSSVHSSQGNMGQRQTRTPQQAPAMSMLSALIADMDEDD